FSFSFLIRRAPSSTLFPYTTLFRSVRDLDRIFLIFKRNHSCDGTEDLFASNPRIIIDVIKDCRFDVVAFGKLLRTTAAARQLGLDRKSTRLNSSHVSISYAVFCLKK